MRKKRILEEVEATLDYRKGNLEHIEEITTPEDREKIKMWFEGAICELEWVKEMLEK